MTLTKHHPLTSALSAAVPLWAMRFIGQPIEVIFDGKAMARIENDLMETGEAILYKTKPGESARAFNALAEGIARLAFSPGGVHCFGMTFEYFHDRPWSEGKHGVPDKRASADLAQVVHALKSYNIVPKTPRPAK